MSEGGVDSKGEVMRYAIFMIFHGSFGYKDRYRIRLSSRFHDGEMAVPLERGQLEKLALRDRATFSE